ERGRRHRSAQHSELHSFSRRSLHQQGPDVELAEHECIRSKCLERSLRIGRCVERQIIVKVGADSSCERFGARRKERVGELHFRMLRAKELDDRECLKSFAYRWRVDPQQWPGRIAIACCPLLITSDYSTTSSER